MSVPTRSEILSLYRRILRLSRSWEATNKAETSKERDYIRSEAITTFRLNKEEKDENKIRQYMKEAQSRLELAIHYRTPYPRPMNLPPHALVKRKGKEQGRYQEKLKKQSTPVYIKSKFEY